VNKLRALLKRVAGWRWALPSLVVAGFVFAFLSEEYPFISSYTRFLLIMMGVNIILSSSLNLVNGYMGEFSVGHAGFMSLGAYASSVLTTKWVPDTPSVFLPSVLFGGTVAAMIGFLLALLSFKTRGDYLAVVTLAFLMIVKSAFENIPYVGGPRGVLGIDKQTTLPWTLFWVVVTLWTLRNLVYSKFGRAVVAIREDEIAANAMGVRTREAKILAFVVSSFFGGVAGALFAHQIQFVNPSSFDILKSTEILVMVYLGGVGSLAGSILGAAILTFLSQVLQPLGTWRMVIMALILVLLMIFRPRGIMGLRELTWFVPRREISKRRPA
jgi:branched-chain amino acid transport system permease protein